MQFQFLPINTLGLSSSNKTAYMKPASFQLITSLAQALGTSSSRAPLGSSNGMVYPVCSLHWCFGGTRASVHIRQSANLRAGWVYPCTKWCIVVLSCNLKSDWGRAMLAFFVSVVCMWPRTSKGVTDLLLPQISIVFELILPLKSWPPWK